MVLEVQVNKKIINKYPNVKHIIFDIDLTKIGGSALTDFDIQVPKLNTDGIPVTYVPARNTIFLSIMAIIFFVSYIILLIPR